MTALDATEPRPSPMVRACIGLVGVGALVFTVVLMISDRAPGITQRLFGGFAERVADRLDENPAVDSERLPGGEAIVHIGVWALAALLVALTVWRWSGLLLCALAVFGASVIVEIGQERYSTSRSMELSDVMANAAGVAAGTLLAIGCMSVWATANAAVRRRRRRTR